MKISINYENFFYKRFFLDFSNKKNSHSFQAFSSKEKNKVFHCSTFLTENSNLLSLPFLNLSFDKGRLKSFVSWFLKTYGQKKTIELLDQFKEVGFGYATKAGISLGIEDLKIPPQKYDLLKSAQEKVNESNIQYKRGEITGVERLQRFIDIWHETSETLKQEVVRHFEATDILNPVYMMAFSGARGNLSQVRQLVGMRGLMADPQGQIIDFPIRSNFREGLTITEYVISTYGARKGIVDTALRTANAGYLTRRLVDVAQHVIVSEFDCGTTRGIFVFEMKEGTKTISSFTNRLIGRVLAKDIFSKTQKIALRNQEISSDLANTLSKITKKALIRSPLTCETQKLVCQLCYGWSLSTNQLVSIGEAVGIIAAQSIGEPGTQLTMRTFHTGGVFSGGITDQIISPRDGFIEYASPIVGTCVRTPQGQVAFLTKSEGSLIFKTMKQNQITSTSLDEKTVVDSKSAVSKNSLNGYDSGTQSYSIQTYKIPQFTLLFVKNSQKVYKKQLIAQLTSFGSQKNQKGDAEQTIYSEYEGEIYNSNIDILEKPSEYGDMSFESWGWGYLWILSGRIYQIPVESFLFSYPTDFINQNSILNRICWISPKQSFLASKFKLHKKNEVSTVFVNKNKNFQPISLTSTKDFIPSELLIPKNSIASLSIDKERKINRKVPFFFSKKRNKAFHPDFLKKRNFQMQKNSVFLKDVFFAKRFQTFNITCYNKVNLNKLSTKLFLNNIESFKNKKNIFWPPFVQRPCPIFSFSSSFQNEEKVEELKLRKSKQTPFFLLSFDSCLTTIYKNTIFSTTSINKNSFQSGGLLEIKDFSRTLLYKFQLQTSRSNFLKFQRKKGLKALIQKYNKSNSQSILSELSVPKNFIPSNFHFLSTKSVRILQKRCFISQNKTLQNQVWYQFFDFLKKKQYFSSSFSKNKIFHSLTSSKNYISYKGKEAKSAKIQMRKFQKQPFLTNTLDFTFPPAKDDSLIGKKKVNGTLVQLFLPHFAFSKNLIKNEKKEQQEMKFFETDNSEGMKFFKTVSSEEMELIDKVNGIQFTDQVNGMELNNKVNGMKVFDEVNRILEKKSFFSIRFISLLQKRTKSFPLQKIYFVQNNNVRFSQPIQKLRDLRFFLTKNLLFLLFSKEKKRKMKATKLISQPFEIKSKKGIKYDVQKKTLISKKTSLKLYKPILSISLKNIDFQKIGYCFSVNINNQTGQLSKNQVNTEQFYTFSQFNKKLTAQKDLPALGQKVVGSLFSKPFYPVKSNKLNQSDSSLKLLSKQKAGKPNTLGSYYVYNENRTTQNTYNWVNQSKTQFFLKWLPSEMQISSNGLLIFCQPTRRAELKEKEKNIVFFSKEKKPKAYQPFIFLKKNNSQSSVPNVILAEAKVIQGNLKVSSLSFEKEREVNLKVPLFFSKKKNKVFHSFLNSKKTKDQKLLSFIAIKPIDSIFLFSSVCYIKFYLFSKAQKKKFLQKKSLVITKFRDQNQPISFSKENSIKNKIFSKPNIFLKNFYFKSFLKFPNKTELRFKTGLEKNIWNKKSFMNSINNFKIKNSNLQKNSNKNNSSQFPLTLSKNSIPQTKNVWFITSQTQQIQNFDYKLQISKKKLTVNFNEVYKTTQENYKVYLKENIVDSSIFRNNNKTERSIIPLSKEKERNQKIPYQIFEKQQFTNFGVNRTLQFQPICSSMPIFYFKNRQGKKKIYFAKHNGILQVIAQKKSETYQSINSFSATVKVVFLNFYLNWSNYFLNTKKNLSGNGSVFQNLRLKTNIFNYFIRKTLATKLKSHNHNLNKKMLHIHVSDSPSKLSFCQLVFSSSFKNLSNTFSLYPTPTVGFKKIEKTIETKTAWSVPIKDCSPTLNILIQQGWLYFSNSNLIDSISQIHQTVVMPGKILLDDVIFEGHRVYIKALNVFFNYNTSLKNKKTWLSDIISEKKSSFLIQKQKRNNSQKTIDCKKFQKFDNVLLNSKSRWKLLAPKQTQILVLFQPMQHKIFPNIFFYKKKLQLWNQNGLFDKYVSSLLIQKKFHSNSLNKQYKEKHGISIHLERVPDFQIFSSSEIQPIGLSFLRKKQKAKSTSVFDFWSFKKSKNSKKTLVFDKNNENSLGNSKSNIDKVIFLVQSYWKPKFHSFLSKNFSSTESIYYSYNPISLENLLIQFDDSSFIEKNILLNEPFVSFTNIWNCSFKNSLFSLNIHQTPMSFQTKLMNRSILANILFQKNFLNQSIEPKERAFIVQSICKTSFTPSYNLFLTKKMSFLANQRLLANLFMNQIINPTNLMPSPQFSIPIFKNQFLLNDSHKISNQKPFAFTSFLSPFEGEILSLLQNTWLSQSLPFDFLDFSKKNKPLFFPSKKEKTQNLSTFPIQEREAMGLDFSIKKQKEAFFKNQKLCLILTSRDLFSVSLTGFNKNHDTNAQIPLFSNIQTIQKNVNFGNKNNWNFYLISKNKAFIESEKYLKKKYFISNFSVFNLLIRHKQKLYKVKSQAYNQIGSISPYRILRVGSFLIYGDVIAPNCAIDQAGQIIHMNAHKITLRYAQAVAVSPRGMLHVYKGDYIKKHVPIMTLPFQTFKTGDIVQGIPKVEQYFEARTSQQGRFFRESLPNLLYGVFQRYCSFLSKSQFLSYQSIQYQKERSKAVRYSLVKIQQILVDGVQRVYRSQGVSIVDKHLEIIVRQMTSKVRVVNAGQTGFFPGELLDIEFAEHINSFLITPVQYEPVVLGITRASLEVESFLSAASFQQTAKILSKAALYNKKDFLKGLKENLMVGNLIPAGTGYLVSLDIISN
jgi:hypothetical protein